MSQKVDSTTDYKKFSMLIANRSTSRNHINQLKTSISAHPEILEAQPILVNEKYQIIDGQHRFQAASELGLPIFYTMVSGIGIETARTMNVLQRRWDPIDFAKSYALTGNDNYKIYLRMRNDYQLPHNVTLAALIGRKQHGINAVFKRGELKDIDANRADDYLSKINEIGVESPIPMISPFAYALITIFSNKDFEYDRMLDNVKKYGATMMKRYSQLTDYLRMLEDIYNMNKQFRTRLF